MVKNRTGHNKFNLHLIQLIWQLVRSLVLYHHPAVGISYFQSLVYVLLTGFSELKTTEHVRDDTYAPQFHFLFMKHLSLHHLLTM